MILLDVNILVSAHREDADQHREIKSWLESSLQEPAGVAVSELQMRGAIWCRTLTARRWRLSSVANG